MPPKTAPAKPTLKRRARGRPALAAEIGSRDALLDAAVALFAEKGVPATTSADIAARAGVTPAMIHYHFRSRDRLLDAVVDERLSRFVASVFAMPMPANAGAAALVETIVRRLYAAAERMPWMPPIWIREVVSEGGTLRERMLRHFPREAIVALIERIAREQHRRGAASGVEPRLVLLTLAGVAMLPLATRALWSRILEMGDLTNAQLLRHALAVLSGGLVPAQTPARRRA